MIEANGHVTDEIFCRIMFGYYDEELAEWPVDSNATREELAEQAAEIVGKLGDGYTVEYTLIDYARDEVKVITYLEDEHEFSDGDWY